MEDVDYKIKEIEQHPASLLQTFSVVHAQPRFFHL
jgi:hypothetical protein